VLNAGYQLGRLISVVEHHAICGLMLQNEGVDIATERNQDTPNLKNHLKISRIHQASGKKRRYSPSPIPARIPIHAAMRQQSNGGEWNQGSVVGKNGVAGSRQRFCRANARR